MCYVSGSTLPKSSNKETKLCEWLQLQRVNGGGRWRRQMDTVSLYENKCCWNYQFATTLFLRLEALCSFNCCFSDSDILPIPGLRFLTTSTRCTMPVQNHGTVCKIVEQSAKSLYGEGKNRESWRQYHGECKIMERWRQDEKDGIMGWEKNVKVRKVKKIRVRRWRWICHKRRATTPTTLHQQHINEENTTRWGALHQQQMHDKGTTSGRR